MERDFIECQTCKFFNPTIYYNKANMIVTHCHNCGEEMLIYPNEKIKTMLLFKTLGQMKKIPCKDEGGGDFYYKSNVDRTKEEQTQDWEYTDLLEKDLIKRGEREADDFAEYWAETSYWLHHDGERIAWFNEGRIITISNNFPICELMTFDQAFKKLLEGHLICSKKDIKDDTPNFLCIKNNELVTYSGTKKYSMEMDGNDVMKSDFVLCDNWRPLTKN